MMGLAAVIFGARVARLAPARCRAAAASRSLVGRRRRRAERGADRAAAAAAADRHARARSRCFAASPKGSRRRRSTTPAFRRRFLALGQGYLRGVIPAQLPIFVAVAARLCRAAASIGRSAARCTRSGSAPPARAMPASRSRNGSALVYVLSGVMASLAGDHLRRASRAGASRTRAPATSSTRSPRSCSAARRCSAAAARSGGTLLGLFALSVLKNGLQLAALPSELTGVLTGVLLDRDDCASIGSARRRAAARRADRRIEGGDST